MRKTQFIPTRVAGHEVKQLFSPPSSPAPKQVDYLHRGLKLSVILPRCLNDSASSNRGSSSSPMVSKIEELEAYQEAAASTSGSSIPNPWIDNPNPTSEIYPNITYRLKSFKNSSKIMHDSQERWPYRLYPADVNKVLFFEFRGYGPPPPDIGDPGDFYLDLTHEGSWRHLIYIREEHSWVCNNWSADPNHKEFWLHEHPLLNDRYLWGTAASGFMWFTGDTLRTLGCYRIRDEHNPETMIEEALSYPFDRQKLPDDEEKEKAEIERRDKKRARWKLKSVPPTPEELKRKEAEREKRRLYEAESRKKHEERNQRRHSAMHQEEGEESVSEQEPVLVDETIPIDFNTELPDPQNLRDLPIPAKRRRAVRCLSESDDNSSTKRPRVMKASNGSQAALGDGDEMGRQRLGIRRWTSRIRRPGTPPLTFQNLQRSSPRERRWEGVASVQNWVKTQNNCRVDGVDDDIVNEEEGGGSVSDYMQEGDREEHDEDEEGQGEDPEDGEDKAEAEGGDKADDEGNGGDGGDNTERKVDEDSDEEQYEDTEDEDGEEKNEDSESGRNRRSGMVKKKVSSRGRPPFDGNTTGEGDKDPELHGEMNIEQKDISPPTRPTDPAGGSSGGKDAAAPTLEHTQRSGEKGPVHVINIDEPKDTLESISQKAADVHLFILKNYGLIEKERDTLKAHIPVLKGAIQESKDEVLLLRGRVIRLNEMLEAQRQANTTATAELEEVKQSVEQFRAREAVLKETIRDMTLQRDRAITEQNNSERERMKAVKRLVKAKGLFTAAQKSLDEA